MVAYVIQAASEWRHDLRYCTYMK